MNTVAALIVDLIAAGVERELVGRVASALAERPAVLVPDEAAERRRAKDRDRQAEIRRNRQMSAESADVCGSPPGSSEPLPSSLLPSGEKAKDEPLVRPKKRPDTSTRLPMDWRPTAEEVQFAIDEGFSPDAVQREVERFRDYWHGKPGAAGRKIQWDGTWRNWVRNATDRGQSGNKVTKNGRPQNAHALAEAGDAAIRAAEDAERRARYGDGEAGQVLDWPIQRLPGFR